MSRIAWVSSVPPLAVSAYVHASMERAWATRTMWSTAFSALGDLDRRVDGAHRGVRVVDAHDDVVVAAGPAAVTATSSGSCPRRSAEDDDGAVCVGRDGIRRRAEQAGEQTSAAAASDDDEIGVLDISTSWAAGLPSQYCVVDL